VRQPLAHSVSPPSLLDDQIYWINQKSNELKKQREIRAASMPVQMFLPGMEAFLRAMPNHIARSSLFAPVAHDRKNIHVGSLLVSRGMPKFDFGVSSWTNRKLTSGCRRFTNHAELL